MEPAPGLQASVHHTVAAEDTAAAVGSGDLDVLATPRLLALAEAATVAAIAGHLAAGETSVGSRVQLEHLRASPIGAQLSVHARLGHVDGRLLRFDVAAEHGDGTVVASGQITRVVVDAERFRARVGGQS
jgi:fluoroacetyl-CoA thioesterase